MKKILLLISLSFIQIHVFSQHQADHWFFGTYAGLDFTSGSPVPITGAMATTEGCSSISDAQGNLLFYTNGVSVWNRNNQEMPNGDSLDGDVSSTQSALIVPAPGSSDSLYYVFTLDEIGGGDGFRYSIVDMTQDTGLGDVITKNVFIRDSVTEKVAAVQQSNEIDFWVVIHQWGTNTFFAYSLTAAGVQPAPVVSQTGIIHSTSQIQNTFGQMKFSTCSDKLAVAAGYLDTVQLFDFNPFTGVVSNPITLPMNDHVYGVEFSPDGNLLYVTCYDEQGSLLQFEVSSNSADTIMASKTVISSMGSLYALQLAPDYKIYVTQSFSADLGVINDPNVPGPFCNWDNTGVYLDPNYMGINSGIGLPEFVQSFFKGKGPCGPTEIQEVSPGEKNLLFPNPSSEEFTIDLSNYNSVSNIIARNAEGKIMAKFTRILPGKFSFGKNFPAGIYSVHVQSDSGSKSIMAVKMEGE